MSGAIDVPNRDKPKRVVILASTSAVSEQTGWRIGFSSAELTHPYWEFVETFYGDEAVNASAPAQSRSPVKRIAMTGRLKPFR